MMQMERCCGRLPRSEFWYSFFGCIALGQAFAFGRAGITGFLDVRDIISSITKVEKLVGEGRKYPVEPSVGDIRRGLFLRVWHFF